MKKYLLLTFSCAFLAGCATLDPVYEKLNAQVAAFKKVVNPAAPVPAVSAAVQESSEYFFENILNCSVDPRFPVEVHLSKVHFDYSSSKRKKLEKPGMVGLIWEDRKLVWAKPERLPNGSYRIAFPGRKLMIITQTRVRDEKLMLQGTYEADKEFFDPYISIEEVGGKKWICGEATH